LLPFEFLYRALNPLAPKATFALPVVLLVNALKPTAVWFEAVFAYNDAKPNAVLLAPVTLYLKALAPIDTLYAPVVLLLRARNPTAVLFDAVFNNKA